MGWKRLVPRYLISGNKSTSRLTIGTGFDSFGLHSPCTLGLVDASIPPASIGRPLGDTSVMIMTGQKDLRLLPRGALGELCFGGYPLVSSTGSLYGLETNARIGPWYFWIGSCG